MSASPPGTRSSGSPTSVRTLRRQAVWAVFLRNLYGQPRGETKLRAAEDLAALEALGWLSRSQIVARPRLLQRILAPVVLSGDTKWTAELRELVLAAATEVEPRPSTFEGALSAVRARLEPRFAVDWDDPVRPRRRALRRILDPEDLVQAEPSRIRSANGTFTVSRRALVRAAFDDLVPVVDPCNWASFGEFFDRVARLDGADIREKDGWSGFFEEHFRVAWGPWSISTVNPILRVDYTHDEQCARADYALAWERDDQLETDDGFIEIRRLSGRVGWCEYYAEKSTRFRSPSVNLLSPAIMAVFIDSNLSALEDVVYREDSPEPET